MAGHTAQKARLLQAERLYLPFRLGAPAEDYCADGFVGYSVAEVLRPFELTAKYCRANYRQQFTFHMIDSNAGYSKAVQQAAEKSTTDYLSWLSSL